MDFIFNIFYQIFIIKIFAYLLYNLLFIINIFLLLIIIKKLSLKFNIPIKNFFFAYFWAGFFVIYQITFLVILRVSRITESLNLKDEFTKYLDYFYVYLDSVILRYLFILNIIVIIIIYFKIHKLMTNNLWKVVFYLIQSDFSKKSNNCFTYYLIFRSNLSYVKFCLKLTILLQNPLLKYFNKHINNKQFYMTWIQRTLTIILIFILFYDCFFNNFTLNYTYYYLFVYIILKQWIIISLDIQKQYFNINQMLFDVYYNFPKVIYVNLSLEEKLAVKAYINNYVVDIDLFQKIYQFNRFEKKIKLNLVFYENKQYPGYKLFLENLEKDSDNFYDIK